MVFLAGAIGLLAIHRLTKIVEISVSLVEKAIPKVHLLSEITHLISTMDRDIERLLLNQGQPEFWIPIVYKEKKVRALLTVYEKFLPGSPNEIEQALREFKPRYTSLENTAAKIITFARQGQTQRARALLSGNWKDQQSATLDSLSDLMNFEDEEAGRDVRLVQTESRDGRNQMIYLAGVGVFLGIALALWISSSVTRPITKLVGVMERVSRGDLTSRAEIRRQDEIGYLAGRFNEMIDRLNKSFEEQRRLYGDASHELRTPLTAIRGIAEVALRGPEKSFDEYGEALKSIVELASEMGQLVDDLLFLARSDAGQMPYEMAEVAVAPLLEEVIDQSRGLASATDLRMGLEVGTPDGIAIWGDAKRLRQLFLILMDNAIKYTNPGGSVTLALKPQADWVSVVVSDTGIGIAEKDVPHIFERFYRVDTSRARSEAGAGLGLSIAQTIVKAHQGKIVVESAVGQGATFSVLLPRSHRKNDGVA